MRTLLIVALGVVTAILVAVSWLAGEIHEAKTPNPNKLGDLAFVDALFRPDYPDWHDPSNASQVYFNRYDAVPGGCIRYGTETVWREVNGVKSGTRSHRFPKGETPACGDFVRLDVYEEYGRYVDPWACKPYLLGAVLLDPSRSRYLGSDIYLARVPGERPPSDYVDAASGRLVSRVLDRAQSLPSTRNFAAEIPTPDSHRFQITAIPGCTGFELWRVEIRPR
ncbi:MAG: hypothetical protein AAGK00_01270 [Pseudomonadota bacterium]